MVLLKRKPRLRKVKGLPPKAQELEKMRQPQTFRFHTLYKASPCSLMAPKLNLCVFSEDKGFLFNWVRWPQRHFLF